MKLEHFVEKFSNIHAKNRVLKLTVILLTIGIIVSSFFSYKALSYQKVVLVPPNLDRKVQVSGVAVDPNYLKAMGMFVVYMAYNFSPETVKLQYKELLSLYAPDSYLENERVIKSMADRYSENQVVVNFFPSDMKIDTGKGIVSITGQYKKYILGELISSKPKAEIIIKYRVANGLFQIVKLGMKSESFIPEKKLKN